MHKYDPECPGCLPCICDPDTFKPLASDHPIMVEAYKVWWEMPYEVREAYINLTLNNVRDEETIKLASTYISKLETVVEKIGFDGFEPPVSH